MFLTIILLVSYFMIAESLFGMAKTQSVGVRGVLMCNSKPAAHVKVKLYDHNLWLGMDDLMAVGSTDGYGNFELIGHTKEFSTIDPNINIYRDCEDGVRFCQRKITFLIPHSYEGKEPKTIFDPGTIQPAAKFIGEKRDCLN